MTAVLEFNLHKAVQAMNLLSRLEGSQIDKVKLLKLIYLADRIHVRRFGRPILNDVYWAMKFGPVASAVKDIAEFSDQIVEPDEMDYVSSFLAQGETEHAVRSVAEVDESVFSSSELEALNTAFSQFGHLNNWKLSKLTHEYPEWKKHEATLESNSGASRVRMSYGDFFENPEASSDAVFQESSEALSAAKELFEEERELADLWR